MIEWENLEKKAIVSISKGESLRENVTKAIDLIGGMSNIVGNGDMVVIKPNYTVALPPETGLTTDPKILEVIARMAFDAGAREVIVAEGSGSSDLVDVDGLGDVAWRTGAKIVDINKVPEKDIVNAEIPGPIVLNKIPIPKFIVDCDVFINVPKMKMTGMIVTLGLKNLMGVTPGKGRYFEWNGNRPRHPFIPAGGKKIIHSIRTEKGTQDGLIKALIDLNRLVHSDLTVIDGMWAAEYSGATHGSPVKMDTIIAGKNVVATDAVCSAVMGFDPTKVDIIRMASEYGLGACDLESIDIKGEPIKKVYRGFEPSNIRHYEAYLNTPPTEFFKR